MKAIEARSRTRGETVSPTHATPTVAAANRARVRDILYSTRSESEEERAAGAESTRSSAGGGRAVGDSPDPLAVPAPLARFAVSAPGDTAERDAHQMARAAVAAAAPVRSSPPGDRPTAIAPPASPTRDELGSRGHPLPTDTSAELSARLGHDLRGVRVFHDAIATNAARSLGADAFTLGQNVYFDADRYRLHTPAGRALLAHELAHTVQQRGQAPVIYRSLAGGCAEPMETVDEQRDELSRAGRLAHHQIQKHYHASFAWQDDGEVRVPRATKAQRNVMCPGPDVPEGKLDLWKWADGEQRVEIGEIKSVAGAQRGLFEVKHYRRRADEVVGRLNDGDPCPGPADDKDEAFDRRWFGGRVSGGTHQPEFTPLASAIPTTPNPLGPFDGNRRKDLFCELRETGVVAYWCKARNEDKDEQEKDRQAIRAAQPAADAQTPLQLVGAHPYFGEYAARLPPTRAPANRDFIIVVADDIFREVEAEAERHRLEHQRRIMQIDPRGVPFIQVQAPLIPIAVVFAALEVALIMVMAAEIVVAAPAALAPAETAAAVGAAETTAATAGGPTLTVIQGGGSLAATGAASKGTAVVSTMSKAAAALVAERLVTGGMSEAEAAEAVEPLVGKRLSAFVDITDEPALAGIKRGGEVTIDGETYRAVVMLTTKD